MNLLNWILIGALIIILNVVWSLARSWWKQQQAKQAGEQSMHKTKPPPATSNRLDVSYDNHQHDNHQIDTSPPSNQIHEPLITGQVLVGPKRPEAYKPPRRALIASIPEHISLNLTCSQDTQDSPIDGPRLMQLINEHNLTLNKDGLFQSQGDDGSIHFKIANVISPGTFTLPAMHSFKTEGLMLFTVRKETSQPRLSWLQMWQLAEKIVTTFSADIKDEQHQPLTEERLAQFQQCVVQWEENPIV